MKAMACFTDKKLARFFVKLCEEHKVASAFEKNCRRSFTIIRVGQAGGHLSRHRHLHRTHSWREWRVEGGGKVMYLSRSPPHQLAQLR